MLVAYLHVDLSVFTLDTFLLRLFLYLRFSLQNILLFQTKHTAKPCLSNSCSFTLKFSWIMEQHERSQKNSELNCDWNKSRTMSLTFLCTLHPERLIQEKRKWLLFNELLHRCIKWDGYYTLSKRYSAKLYKILLLDTREDPSLLSQRKGFCIKPSLKQ